jgi:alpha 1,2-mannosyltransferase
VLGPEAAVLLSRAQAGVFAVLLSSFQHCLFLDPEALPLVDPHAELFTQEPYLTTGLVSWPGFWGGEAAESPSSFRRAVGPDGVPPEVPASSATAGLFAVDKARHLKTLLLAAYYDVWGPGHYYPLLNRGGGANRDDDASTLDAAATVLGARRYRVQTPAAAVERWNGGVAEGTAAVQHHPLDDWEAANAPPPPTEQNRTAAPRVRAAFLRATAPPLDAGRLLAPSPAGGASALADRRTGLPLRLWGDPSALAKMLGADQDEDVERKAMGFVVETSCQLDRQLADWRACRDVCVRMKEYFRAVYG